jgi:hypothetical protein
MLNNIDYKEHDDNFKAKKITNASLISGEDLTNDVLKVEQRFSYAYCTADTAVKSGSGFLHAITISPTDAAATAGTIIVYDILLSLAQSYSLTACLLLR